MMLRSVKALYGYTIAATDGDIGGVYAFYFDDQAWTIRYLIVDTGTWLPGREVLISPAAVGQPQWEMRRLPVNLTQAQVENSPDIDTDQPVSRQYETALHDYYAWPVYWTAIPVDPGGLAIPPELAENLATRPGDPHLRSTQEVIGYYIQASDGDLGHVEDFIIDDEDWTIRYMVIDTRNWLPGKKVVVSPEWITEVAWGESKVHVDLTREAIKNSPEYDPVESVNRLYEERLYDFYGRPKYWR
jgi:hypothetical protein